MNTSFGRINDTLLGERRGVGLYWEDYEKVEFGPVKKEEVKANRQTE